MKKFIMACRYARAYFPLLWLHHNRRNRRIMVRYYLPGDQLALFPWSV